jgi:soluble lytic murein transglycosylase
LSGHKGLQRRLAGSWLIAALLLGGTAGVGAHRAKALRLTGDRRQSVPVSAALTSTPRPRLPGASSPIWLVPDAVEVASVPKAATGFASAMRLFAAAKYAEALPLFTAPALADTPLAAYATFYGGLCSLNLSRAAVARTAFAAVRASQASGFVVEAAIGREADAAAAQGDHAAAATLYEELARRKTASPDAVLLSVGQAHKAAGDRTRAAQAFSRLYYESPTSDLASSAAAELSRLEDVLPAKRSAGRVALELGRADRLFSAKRYQPARQALEALVPLVTGDDAERVEIRLAGCDHFLRRYRQARERLAPLLDTTSRKEEARFYFLSATRGLGSRDEYVALARALVGQFPSSPWAEETLNNLATHYIVSDEDEQADAVFRELYAKFPKGAYAERAAWRAGWRAYRHGSYRDTTGFFESAVATFPRSDYRPAYLYWSARARERAGDSQGAAAVYAVATTDYLNTYYGRLALIRLQGMGIKTASSQPGPGPQPAAAAAPPTADLIRLLLALGLHEQARDELLFAQRTYGDTPLVGATLGWVYNKLGDYRRGTVLMKRAYPQYMSEEGARLPVELLKVIFPLDYWDLITKYALANQLDPYLMAALINQESAFDARIKSSAGAIGLMQVMPSTGRQYARKLGLKRYTTSSLTRPETNIQIGMVCFADALRRSGGVTRALAAYNAGEQRVVRWNQERPGLELEEYIDDLPFPETQTYVKKILGTADDYGRLYGEGSTPPQSSARASAAPTPPGSRRRRPS